MQRQSGRLHLHMEIPEFSETDWNNQLQAEIQRELRREKSQALYRDWIARLKEKAYIKKVTSE